MSNQGHLQEHSASSLESNNAGPDPASRTTRKLAYDYEILPLLGHPYFTVIIAKSHVQAPNQLIVPSSFLKSLPRRTVKALFACRGKTWEVIFCGNCSLKRFSSGWKKFAKDNNLMVGDACIFELLEVYKEVKFRVQILDGQLPGKIFKSGSFDRPIDVD